MSREVYEDGSLVFVEPEDFQSDDELFPSCEETLTGGSSSYYDFPEGAAELQDLIEHREMNFAVGNIFKACYRLGNKPGTTDVYDLEKIIWYAERELRRRRGQDIQS